MKTYRVLTWGASGSGKTVFLASMFKNLSLQGDDGFYLNVDDRQQQKILNLVYTDLIAGGVWPTETKYSEISEWSFTCCVKNVESLDSYAACRFVYYDYAGGRFTDMDEDDTQLQEVIKSSDAILGLLDGQKILALMNNDRNPKLELFLNKDLPEIIKWMSDCFVPIQFVISKWDLLEGNFSLQQISDRLLEIPQFAALIRDRNQQGYPVRLIPVSSVGMDFVKPDSDGGMTKIPGATPYPFLVEVPVSCVIPDRLKQDIILIAKQEADITNQGIGKTDIFHKISKGLLGVSPFINLAVAGIVAKTVCSSDQVAQTLANGVDDLLFSLIRTRVEAKDRKLDELRLARDRSLQTVQDEKTALKNALNSFLCIEEKLTRDFPESEVVVQQINS